MKNSNHIDQNFPTKHHKKITQPPYNNLKTKLKQKSKIQTKHTLINTYSTYNKGLGKLTQQKTKHKNAQNKP